MFVELFQYLPLFTIINNAVMVVHGEHSIYYGLNGICLIFCIFFIGGLFHCKSASLAELEEINRADFTLKDLPQNGEPIQHIPRENKSEYLKQLQRDALWSDPSANGGLQLSTRGAGIQFGPDIAVNFLQNNQVCISFILF